MCSGAARVWHEVDIRSKTTMKRDNMGLCLIALLLTQTFAGTWAQSTFAAAVKPMVGVGNVGQFVQPTIQLPIAERNVPTVTWQPTTVYRPVVQNYRLGFCVPRQAWRIDGAYADRCPAQTYLQTLNNQQVCTATRCAGPVGLRQPAITVPQQFSSTAAAAIVRALQNRQQQWGANQASVCNTVVVKPVMTCPDNCIPDTRNPQADLCLCPNGYLPCPYNYQNCNCEPYQICVADSYFCTLYCNYLPSWVPAMVKQGTFLCPIDPDNIDFSQADPVYPGWAFNQFGRRRLMSSEAPSSSSAAAAEQAEVANAGMDALLEQADLQLLQHQMEEQAAGAGVYEEEAPEHKEAEHEEEQEEHEEELEEEEQEVEDHEDEEDA